MSVIHTGVLKHEEAADRRFSRMERRDADGLRAARGFGHTGAEGDPARDTMAGRILTAMVFAERLQFLARQSTNYKLANGLIAFSI